MDQGGIKVWIGMVWCSWPGGLLKMQSLLTLDSFSAHLVPAVCSRLQKEDTESCVIPWGLTSQLQPLDSVRHMFIPSGSLKKPDITTVCTWIKKKLGMKWDQALSQEPSKSAPFPMHWMKLKTISYMRMTLMVRITYFRTFVIQGMMLKMKRILHDCVARKWHVPNDLLIIFLLVTLNYVKIRHLVPNSLVRLVQVPRKI